MRKNFFALAAVAAMCSSMSQAHAGAAPKQLYNKSITVYWNESTVQKAPDGSTRTPQTARRSSKVAHAG